MSTLPRIFCARFAKAFPKGRLTIINQSHYRTDQLTGISLEEFLLGAG